MHARSCPTLFNSMDWAPQAPPMGFPRQEYWSGLPFLPPGDIHDPGIEPLSPVDPALQVHSLLLSHQGSPRSFTGNAKSFLELANKNG